ncbi:hypothetical protein BJX76DRAFT_337444 [Aspergillus varians]
MSASILITGGTTGLGYQCALVLAQQFPDHRIVLASRTNAKDAATSINRQLHQKNVEFIRLDLSSLSEVRKFVESWTGAQYPPIQYLLLNAGIQLPGPVEYTEDGYEKTFAVNHLGHVFLFSLLLPHFARTARIILTGSGTHDPAQRWLGVPDAEYITAEKLAHPSAESAEMENGRQRYSTSKLVALMWAYALERRLKQLRDTGEKDWTVATMCPGMVPGTSLARGEAGIVRFMLAHVLPRCLPVLRLVLGRPNIYTIETAGSALAWVTSSREVVGISGKYYELKSEVKSSEASYEEAKQAELWEWTVNHLALSPEEAAQFSLTN